MTGIVNTTGAKSGVIGTTVGTPVSNNYAFRAYKTSAQNIPENNTELVEFHADVHSSWDGSSGFDLSSNYYVTPVTGIYHIGFIGRVQDAVADSVTYYGSKMNITKNQTITAESQITVGNQGFGVTQEEEQQFQGSLSASGIMSLTAGDILRLYCGAFLGDDRTLLYIDDSSYNPGGSYQTFMYGYKI